MKTFLVAGSEDQVTERALDRLTLIPSSSVLVVVRSGILSRTLPVAINTIPVTINQDMRAFVPAHGIEARFIAWQLVAQERSILSECGKDGTTVASIEGPALAGYPLVLPPLAEQVRIVDKLEELLSDLDAGVAELKAAQKKLAQYRQSLLKAAVEGRLTASWREQNPEPRETGAQLLERILRERRALWESERLTRSSGKVSDGWKNKYPTPELPVANTSLCLPRSWAWATVDQLSVSQRYGTSSKTDEDDSGVPVVRMGNIQNGQLELSSLKYLAQDHHEFPDLLLTDGELVFNRTNSPELVGKSAVYRSELVPCSFASYLIGVRLSTSVVPELVSSYINSLFGRQWVKSVVTQQVGQANVNGSKLAALAFPLPPVDEQLEILRTLTDQLASQSSMASAIKLALRQAAAQRKNILRAAFSGQLVPQDPNDEPASVLLERIRAERAASAGNNPGSGRKKSSAAA